MSYAAYYASLANVKKTEEEGKLVEGALPIAAMIGGEAKKVRTAWVYKGVVSEVVLSELPSDVVVKKGATVSISPFTEYCILAVLATPLYDI